MWNCKACEVEIEDESWESCWNCGCPKNRDPLAYASDLKKANSKSALACLRCNVSMVFGGKKRFNERGRVLGFFLGNLADLFVSNEEYLIYACPKCGKIEFFGEIRETDRNSSEADV